MIFDQKNSNFSILQYTLNINYYLYLYHFLSNHLCYTEFKALQKCKIKLETSFLPKFHLFLNETLVSGTVKPTSN